VIPSLTICSRNVGRVAGRGERGIGIFGGAVGFFVAFGWRGVVAVTTAQSPADVRRPAHPAQQVDPLALDDVDRRDLARAREPGAVRRRPSLAVR
jgi:hypothetical protein